MNLIKKFSIPFSAALIAILPLSQIAHAQIELGPLPACENKEVKKNQACVNRAGAPRIKIGNGGVFNIEGSNSRRIKTKDYTAEHKGEKRDPTETKPLDLGTLLPCQNRGVQINHPCFDGNNKVKIKKKDVKIFNYEGVTRRHVKQSDFKATLKKDDKDCATPPVVKQEGDLKKLSDAEKAVKENKEEKK